MILSSKRIEQQYSRANSDSTSGAAITQLRGSCCNRRFASVALSGENCHGNLRSHSGVDRYTRRDLSRSSDR